MDSINKKILFLSAFCTVAGTVLAAIYFSPAAGMITGLVLISVGLHLQNVSLFLDMRNELIQKLLKLEAELYTIENEVATKAGVPFVSKYLQLHEGPCPLIKEAALKVYKTAVTHLDLLAQHHILVSNQADAFSWLELLFCNMPEVRSIKATSFGEYKEWQASDTWWTQNYLKLHQAAYEKGTLIERIFIVRSEAQAKGVEPVFKINVKNHVIVKFAVQGKIQNTDMQSFNNCMVFLDEFSRPLYALVAKHDHRNEFESASIYGDPEHVKRIADSYARIDSISQLYRLKQPDQLQSRKTA